MKWSIKWKEMKRNENIPWTPKCIQNRNMTSRRKQKTERKQKKKVYGNERMSRRKSEWKKTV